MGGPAALEEGGPLLSWAPMSTLSFMVNIFLVILPLSNGKGTPTSHSVVTK